MASIQDMQWFLVLRMLASRANVLVEYNVWWQCRLPNLQDFEAMLAQVRTIHLHALTHAQQLKHVVTIQNPRRFAVNRQRPSWRRLQ